MVKFPPDPSGSQIRNLGFRGIVERGRIYIDTSLYETIQHVRFMYISDRADVWRPPASYTYSSFLGLHLCSDLGSAV